MKSTYLFIFALVVVTYIGCKPTIDQPKVSYSADIEKIFSEGCGNIYCHGSYHPDGNMLTYENTITFASQNRFLASLKHEDNVSPMPKGGEKLQDEQIDLIERWIEEGMME